LRQAGAQEAVILALRPAPPKPLTKEQVLQLVAGHVPSERVTALVKQHGIDFPVNEQYLDTLRLAGANDALIAALREVSAAVRGELVVSTSPLAGIFLDGELRGQANAQGEIVMKAKLGPHMLKVSLDGKKGNSRERESNLIGFPYPDHHHHCETFAESTCSPVGAVASADCSGVT
jgi:hypothetical protein